MKKHSAGIVLYRTQSGMVEILLGHAGGPFWAKKDAGAWSIPKGECDPEENLQAAAKREFLEETGMPVPEGTLHDLGFFKRKDGKVIYAWAVEGDMDASALRSNTFEMEWPPKSGQKQQFPEFDRAAWFPIDVAGDKMHSGQAIFLERLMSLVPSHALSSASDSPSEVIGAEKKQTSLF